MKDFQLRNDTKLLFRNDPSADLTVLAAKKKTLFVYGGGSAKRNGCYEDVKNAVESAGGTFYELADASRGTGGHRYCEGMPSLMTKKYDSYDILMECM